jgi:tRNA-intron endonuclease, archaea type
MIEVSLKEDYAVASGKDSITLYNLGQYGEPMKGGMLKLNHFETLHLLEKEKIIIKEGQRIIKTNDLIDTFLNLNSKFLTYYFVYKDLRNRGYVVKNAREHNELLLLYERGEKINKSLAKYYVYPLPEGNAIEIKEMNHILNLCRSDDKELIIGLIDASGDLTYLKIDTFEIKKNKSLHLYKKGFEWKSHM